MPQGEPGSLVPGSFRSTISLGTRYVPAPAPGQAAWNELLRGYAPWGPLGVDPSPTGFAGGGWGKFGRALPYVGGAIGSRLAGEAARQKQGQMVPVPPRNTIMDVLDTLRNVLRFTPGGITSPTGIMGIGVGVAKGLTGLFQGHKDRTGMARAVQEGPGQAAPYSPAPMIAPAVTPSLASRFNRYSVPSENPFINPSTGVAPSWAGGPSTWNQPASTWAVPSSTPDYSW